MFHKVFAFKIHLIYEDCQLLVLYCAFNNETSCAVNKVYVERGRLCYYFSVIDAIS